MKKNKYRIVGLALLTALLVACQRDSKQHVVKQHTVVAEKRPIVSYLYYNAVLHPINVRVVASPYTATVKQSHLLYGQLVKKGQLLAVLESHSLASSYREAVSAYVQKKNSMNHAHREERAQHELYRMGAASKNSYAQAEVAYQTALLAYFQANEKLNKVLKETNVSKSEIEKLSLDDAVRIEKYLNKQLDTISVRAPISGVALLPATARSGTTRLEVGKHLKKGQQIVGIGALSGLSASVMVSEVDVNRVKVGQLVSVNSVAFPSIVLKGKVSAVSAEAQSSMSGSLAKFRVNLIVPTIPRALRNRVHAGMTAKISVELKQPPQLLLPIKAVHYRDGQTVVTTDVGGKKTDVSVVTGKTTQSQVVILKGIKSGQKVYVDDQ